MWRFEITEFRRNSLHSSYTSIVFEKIFSFVFAFCLSKECPPATEDMLDEQTTVLTNLGSGEEAALLRAKMQSRSLLSDMESFKVKFEY